MTGKPRSTTRRRLLDLRLALLGVAVLVLASSWYAFRDVHSTTDMVRERTAPAMLEAAATRSALAEADSLAMNSFHSDEALLSGPGDRYQNQIAVASQNLAQVAEDNVAGEAASRQLQLVEGLLVGYTGWIEQADVHHRQGDAMAALATADLWYASRLLHAPDTGILAQLDSLLKAQQQALDEQIADGTRTFVSVALWLVPLLALFALLFVAQRFIRNRFHRRQNVHLLLATILLAAFCALPVLADQAQAQLEQAAHDLRQAGESWQARTTSAGVKGQKLLKDMVTKQCSGGCGATVSRFIAEIPVGTTPGLLTDQQLTEQAKRVNEEIATAGDAAGVELLIPIWAAVFAVLVVFGFRSPIEEYRYQPR
jgi:hypothetical protein